MEGHRVSWKIYTCLFVEYMDRKTNRQAGCAVFPKKCIDKLRMYQPGFAVYITLDFLKKLCLPFNGRHIFDSKRAGSNSLTKGNIMKIDYLYAAMVVTDIEASGAFYSKLLSREPDDRPMDTLVQWRGFSNAGIQLFKDAAKAGNSVMTIVVSDIEETKLSLKNQGIVLGEIQQGVFGKIGQLSDLDGNGITFTEPPKNAAQQT